MTTQERRDKAQPKSGRRLVDDRRDKNEESHEPDRRDKKTRRTQPDKRKSSS